MRNEPQLGKDQARYTETLDLLQHFSASENPLINLSAELLAILTTLPQQKESQNLPELHQYLLKCMSQLHNNGLRADYTPRFMEKACYILCAAFDEEIMNTQWGQSVCWENHSLVAHLFKQRNAGEVFFLLLEQARQNPRRMMEFIELTYLLLRLGFKGQFMKSDGHALAQLINDIYDDICQHHGSDPEIARIANPKPFEPLYQTSPLRLIPILLLVVLLCGVLTHIWIQQANQHYSDDLRFLSLPYSLHSQPKDEPPLSNAAGESTTNE